MDEKTIEQQLEVEWWADWRAWKAALEEADAWEAWIEGMKVDE